MKRRSKAGGKASKARGREALKTKRRDAPKTASSSAPIKDAEVARLTRELNEAREQQTATSDVLRVISSSGGQLGPVFQAMLENATRLCEAKFGVLWRVNGETFHTAATQGLPPALAKYLERGPHRSGPETGLARLLKTRACVQILDALEDRAYAERDPLRAAFVELGGVRTVLVVPMLKEGTIVGAMSILRQEVRPFTQRQIELVTHFANQAVIAIENARLLNELRQRTNDLTESLEQQTATSEVLRVISSSRSDLERVFDSLLENATRLCRAKFGNFYLRTEDGFRYVAMHGVPSEYAEMAEATAFRRPRTVSARAPYSNGAVKEGRACSRSDAGRGLH